MIDSLHFILQYYKVIGYVAIGIVLLWIFIICIECLLNKYYGYNRFNFSRTYYRRNRNTSNSCNSI